MRACPSPSPRRWRRLEHPGLIANAVERHSRGDPYAWQLTAKGREVERAVRVQRRWTEPAAEPR